MKWRQHPGMTIAVDWTAKKNKLTNKLGTVIDLKDKFCFEAAVRPMHSLTLKFTEVSGTLVHIIREHVPLSRVLSFFIRAD